jgi:hypothetical protein
VSKQPSSAPWQLLVIYLPLVLLLLIVKCSNNGTEKMSLLTSIVAVSMGHWGSSNSNGNGEPGNGNGATAAID